MGRGRYRRRVVPSGNVKLLLLVTKCLQGQANFPREWEWVGDDTAGEWRRIEK